MYPFSILMHEHVPPNMVAGLGFFSREGPVVDFPGVGQNNFCRAPKVAKLHFHHSKLRKQPFLQKYNEKMSNFKIREGVGPLFDAHVPKTSYDKKAEGITKMYLPISI